MNDVGIKLFNSFSHRVRSTLQDKPAAASAGRDRQQLPDRKTLEILVTDLKSTHVFSGAMSLSLPVSNRNQF